MSAPCGMNYQCPANKLDVSLCQGIVFTECCLFSNKKNPILTGELSTVAFYKSAYQEQGPVSS